jgi:zinc protease
MTTGMTIEAIESWPDRISKVTLDDVKKMAAKHLVIEHSVTGRLLPESRAAAASVRKDAKPGRS